jgi:hypothetical protein
MNEWRRTNRNSNCRLESKPPLPPATLATTNAGFSGSPGVCAIPRDPGRAARLPADGKKPLRDFSGPRIHLAVGLD